MIYMIDILSFKTYFVLESALSLGVTKPPPSTAMGIITSRGDFLIGSPKLTILLLLSVSKVLCRDKLLQLVLGLVTDETLCTGFGFGLSSTSNLIGMICSRS